MPQITIDGQTFEFEGKKTILQVALENGIELPHYCYHPAMSIVASCRICLAEVAQPNPRNDNKVELIPKLLPTCQTPAQDQQIVHTESPKAIANQKAVMEYLLINHPIDCPVCDQAGECYLQDYSYKYGRSASRFQETKIKQPKKDLGPHVLLYSDRCIMCSRCVRFTREVTGTGEIGTFGRAAEEQIDVFPGKPLDNELSANVVDICPVGALLDKDFLMSMRVWNLHKTASIDGITASGDNISIEHNDGKIYRLKPRVNMDVNTWWISDEIRYGWKHVHDENRLRTPWHKQKGVMEECDWNQAYRDVTNAFQRTVDEHGEGSLSLMVSPMLPSEEAFLLGKFVLGLDPQATIGIGPVPFKGEDKTFPGGYTVWAEKAPNARGVRRALELLTDTVHDYDQWLARIGSGDTSVRATLLTGNYPSNWVTESLKNALAEKYTALIDILPNELSASVDLLLAGASWAEKAGTFENIHNRLQSFDQAIPVIELAKTEGQIALDMLGFAGLEPRQRYKADAIRQQMGGAFLSEVHHPSEEDRPTSELEYLPL